MSIEVRPFRREDREQLTALVNAHIGAVLPGGSASVSRVLSQLEREPGEFIVDPWVGERLTLVAVQRDRVVAASHLLRYGADEHVGESYRGAAEIRWFLFWPEAPFWRGALDAADTLLAACVAQLDRWGARVQYADGTLAHPGVYGVPEQWPHVREALGRAGFHLEAGSRTETVFLAEVERLPPVGRPPLAGLRVARSLGVNGTRLTALLGEKQVGYVEVEILDEAERLGRQGRLADIGNLQVVEAQQRRGVGTWLVAHAGEWLRLGRVDRLLAYAGPEDEECLTPFLELLGFDVLARTERGWRREPGATG